MKFLTISFFSMMLLAGSAMAFPLSSAVSLDAQDTKMKTCILQEAKQALLQGNLTKDNIDSQATKIAASCAAKAAVKNDDATIQLATTIIKELLQ